MFPLRQLVISFTSRSAVVPAVASRGVASFKSSLNVEKLYGAKHEDIAKFSLPPQEDNKFSGYIPIKSLIITHCRSSGPGGQNGDKVNTKSEVRFHLESATWIPVEAREKLKKLCASSINKEGFLIVSSERTRKQFINTADCIDRIRSFVFEACKPPPQITEDTKMMLKKRWEIFAQLSKRQ